MSRTFKIAIAAAVLSMTAAPAAFADVASEKITIVVPYGDLDMSKAAGGQTLLKRIEGAAREACGHLTVRAPRMLRSPSKCRRAAIANAVQTVGIGTLTLAWSGKYPVTSMASR